MYFINKNRFSLVRISSLLQRSGEIISIQLQNIKFTGNEIDADRRKRFMFVLKLLLPLDIVS